MIEDAEVWSRAAMRAEKSVIRKIRQARSQPMTDLHEGMWVDCDERMPPEGVVVWTRVGGSSQSTLLKWERGKWRFLGTGAPTENQIDTCTHWLDPTPQPSELDKLAELVDESEEFYCFMHYPKGGTDDVKTVELYRLGCGFKDFVSLSSPAEAIAHLEKRRIVTREQAKEALRRVDNGISDCTPAGLMDDLRLARRYFGQEDTNG